MAKTQKIKKHPDFTKGITYDGIAIYPYNHKFDNDTYYVGVNLGDEESAHRGVNKKNIKGSCKLELEICIAKKLF